MVMKRGGPIQSLGDLLKQYDVSNKGKYISREWQDYAYRLAVELNDLKNKSLYMKLAKQTERSLLEQARTFVKDANNVRHRGKLFLWALTKLKRGEPLYDEKPK